MEHLRPHLSYDPGSGVLSWVKNGLPIKRIDPSNGYIRFYFEGEHFYAHNVIWFLMTGKVPQKKEVDHTDLNRANNVWGNLRKANPSLQQANRGVASNNKLGVKGVSLCKSTGRYRADIRVNKRSINLGRFDTIEEASEAYALAASQYYGEFARAA